LQVRKQQPRESKPFDRTEAPPTFARSSHKKELLSQACIGHNRKRFFDVFCLHLRLPYARFFFFVRAVRCEKELHPEPWYVGFCLIQKTAFLFRESGFSFLLFLPYGR